MFEELPLSETKQKVKSECKFECVSGRMLGVIDRLSLLSLLLLLLSSPMSNQGQAINHAFTTITPSIHFHHVQSPFLPPQTFLFHSMLFSHHPSCSWPSSQLNTPYVGSYYSLHQPVLYHSLHVFKLLQSTLLCLTSQLSHNTSSLSHFISY